MKTKIQTSAFGLFGRNQTSALLRSAIAVAGLFGLSLAGQGQTIISINFQGSNPVGLAAADSTGVHAAANWNNVTGQSGSGVALTDSTGAASGVTLTSYAGYSGYLGNNVATTGNETPQAILFGGSIDSSSWFGAASFAIEGLSKFSSYDLVIYYSGIQNWASGRTGNFSVTGTDTKYYFQTTGSSLDFTEYARSNSTVAGVFATGNHVVFSGLTAGTATALMENLSDYVILAGFQIIGTTGTVDLFGPWIATNYPDLENKTAAGDPDGDGMTNHQEFAFGLDPSSGSSVNPITTPLDKATGTLNYIRRAPAATGLTYTVMTSTDLVDWVADTGATSSQTIVSTTDGIQTMAVTLSEATTLGKPKLFVRIKAQ